MDRCISCGEGIPEGRQVCPRCSGNEGTAFQKLMQNKDVQFEIDDRIEAAYHQGFEAGYSQLETKYWDSQRLIDQYAAENKALKEMLKQAVEDIKMIANATCIVGSMCEECPLYGGKGDLKCRWVYEDKALALIGGGTE